MAENKRIYSAQTTTTMDEELKSNTDCFYFIFSPLACKKGIECEFRHSEMARLNPTNCRYWFSGNCLNPDCAFRHPPLDGTNGGGSLELAHVYQQTAAPMKKSNVPCHFFFNGFCYKGQSCLFLHELETANWESTKTLQAINIMQPDYSIAMGNDTSLIAIKTCANPPAFGTSPIIDKKIAVASNLKSTASSITHTSPLKNYPDAELSEKNNLSTLQGISRHIPNQRSSEPLFEEDKVSKLNIPLLSGELTKKTSYASSEQSSDGRVLNGTEQEEGVSSPSFDVQVNEYDADGFPFEFDEVNGGYHYENEEYQSSDDFDVESPSISERPSHVRNREWDFLHLQKWTSLRSRRPPSGYEDLRDLLKNRRLMNDNEELRNRLKKRRFMNDNEDLRDRLKKRRLMNDNEDLRDILNKRRLMNDNYQDCLSSRMSTQDEERHQNPIKHSLDGTYGGGSLELAHVYQQTAASMNKLNVPCHFFFNGFCNKGQSCLFLHELDTANWELTKTVQAINMQPDYNIAIGNDTSLIPPITTCANPPGFGTRAIVDKKIAVASNLKSDASIITHTSPLENYPDAVLSEKNNPTTLQGVSRDIPNQQPSEPLFEDDKVSKLNIPLPSRELTKKTSYASSERSSDGRVRNGTEQEELVSSPSFDVQVNEYDADGFPFKFDEVDGGYHYENEEYQSSDDDDFDVESPSIYATKRPSHVRNRDLDFLHSERWTSLRSRRPSGYEDLRDHLKKRRLINDNKELLDPLKKRRLMNDNEDLRDRLKKRRLVNDSEDLRDYLNKRRLMNDNYQDCLSSRTSTQDEERHQNPIKHSRGRLASQVVIIDVGSHVEDQSTNVGSHVEDQSSTQQPINSRKPFDEICESREKSGGAGEENP